MILDDTTEFAEAHIKKGSTLHVHELSVQDSKMVNAHFISIQPLSPVCSAVTLGSFCGAQTPICVATIINRGPTVQEQCGQAND